MINVGWPTDLTQLAVLGSLFLHFFLLSLLAIGGAITVAPDMHRLLVSQLGLLTDAQFSASIAIAQAAPGPNILFVAVMGYQAAGLIGALATLVGILLPSTTLAFAVGRWGQQRNDWPVVQAFKAGMAPIVIALMMATAWLLAAENSHPAFWALTVAASVLVWLTKVHLLWLIAAGALVGAGISAIPS